MVGVLQKNCGDQSRYYCCCSWHRRPSLWARGPEMPSASARNFFNIRTTFPLSRTILRARFAGRPFDGRGAFVCTCAPTRERGRSRAPNAHTEPPICQTFEGIPKDIPMRDSDGHAWTMANTEDIRTLLLPRHLQSCSI